jgi:hypothetical protein
MNYEDIKKIYEEPSIKKLKVNIPLKYLKFKDYGKKEKINRSSKKK